MKSFGDRLKYLRGSASQAEIAAKFGIPQMTLSNYETGKSEPKFVMIQKMCSFFMVGADWLLFGNGPMRLSCSPPDQEQDNQKPQVEAVDNAVAICPQCARLEAELEIEKQERRELALELRMVNAENRRWTVKMEHLLRENGELKEERASLIGQLNTLSPKGGATISGIQFSRT